MLTIVLVAMTLAFLRNSTTLRAASSRAVYRCATPGALTRTTVRRG